VGNNSIRDAKYVAGLLKVHGAKYTSAQRDKIESHIRTSATVNLVNDDLGENISKQAGKTTGQPREGGQFGAKAGSGGGSAAKPGVPGAPVEPPPPDAFTFIATANNLQIGQSVALPNNMAKVKRLGTGYQLVKMDGSVNKVVPSLKQVHAWIKQQVPEPEEGGANDGNQPATGRNPSATVPNR
jgi:hypothetical protein